MTLAKMFQLMLGTVGLRFGGAAIGLLTQLALTRVLDPQEVGVVFLTMSVAAIASLLVTAGYPNLALTQLPRIKALGVPRAAKAFHGTFLREFLFLNLLLLALVVCVVLLVPQGWVLQTAMIFGAATAGASGLLRYNSAIANGLKQYAMAFVPDSLVRPGLFFLFVACAALTGFHLSLLAVLMAYVGSNILVVIGQAIAMGRDRLALANWSETRPRFSKIVRLRASSMMITAGVATMFADIVTLVGGFVLMAGDVALLGICIRLAGLAGYVLQVSQQFILPDLTAALTVRDEAAARNILVRVNSMMVGASLVILLGTIFLGQYFLGLFGASYEAGYELLVICMGAQVIRAISGMNQYLLAIHGYQTRSALAAVTGIAILISSAIILARNFGVIGIGFAVVIAEMASGLMLGSQAQKLTGKRADLLWLLVQSR
jgi:O-antigen/teichoic acid export membrane protein